MRMHVSQGATQGENTEERYWGRFALSYDRDGEYVVGRPILQAIVKRLSEERGLGNCAELGCGTGYFTRAIAANAQHVTATDLSDQMLEVARTQLRGFENVTFRKADCGNTGLPAETYDSVLLANLIHVVDSPLLCLQESYRILRDGGMLLAIDFTSYGLGFLRQARLVLRYLKRWGIPPRHGRNHLSPEELRRLVESVGFTVTKAELLRAVSNSLYLRGLKCAKPPST